ncbi:unnamed protein product [Caenorhabditis auriculariae]|uniref:Uncharacterized protein n=1 Tax=Caenorhabditis auriculariae TaxID=2777116 RepID=A0A8S1GYR6_9PELO|nr:unnamed protein product [Caenorhabditis auriculariae]
MAVSNISVLSHQPLRENTLSKKSEVELSLVPSLSRFSGRESATVELKLFQLLLMLLTALKSSPQIFPFTNEPSDTLPRLHNYFRTSGVSAGLEGLPSSDVAAEDVTRGDVPTSPNKHSGRASGPSHVHLKTC